jgi:hypothetical protein
MGMMKNYLLTLLQQCSEEQFGQDVIEWAIVTGRVRLSYELDTDVRSIMSRYDELIEAYRQSPVKGSRKPDVVPAPMKRAVPRRQTRADTPAASIRRKNIA